MEVRASHAERDATVTRLREAAAGRTADAKRAVCSRLWRAAGRRRGRAIGGGARGGWICGMGGSAAGPSAVSATTNAYLAGR